MWQRVQTLYMFISTVLMGMMIFCNKAQGIAYNAYWPYVVMLVIITILNILALTSWKFRIFQMRTAVLSAIITLAFQIWLAVDFFTAPDGVIFNLTAVFPVVSVIFNLLAARNIMADELMVRSASRLRPAKRKK